MQFLSHSIELILKHFLNYSAEENPYCIFFLALLISSSSTLLSLFDTQSFAKIVDSFTILNFIDLSISAQKHNIFRNGKLDYGTKSVRRFWEGKNMTCKKCLLILIFF